MNIRGFLIAAPQSGSGKTTVSLAIMAGLAQRGITVAPFKCGPDFIDPGYHKAVTDRDSINLDGWMCGEEFVLQTFQTSQTSLTSLKPAVAVIEGAMGLFDGLGASSREGSSAQIAAITGAPVVLVVNARGMAASAAALVKGFAGFDPKVRLAGVIFNNVGSENHAAQLKEAVAIHCPEIPCFGAIQRDDTLFIPSRHLGLLTAEDNPLPDEFIKRLADMAERSLDLDGLSQLQIPTCPPLLKGGDISPNFSKGRRGGISVRIAVARDAAFCFCYADNLTLLEKAGAEIIFFSPLADFQLPSDIHGIYLPGGYPELYAKQLAANTDMLTAIRGAIENNMPVYAECGGFIYLTEGMENGDDFVGIFPVRTRMLLKRRALGYRQVEICMDTIIGPAGSIARGHEFHYSDITPMPENIARNYRITRRGEDFGLEGYRYRNCLSSYIHLHFGSNQEIAENFVSACKGHSSAQES